MTLTYDQKLKEYKEWVIKHQKTPPKELHIKFSDGGDMRSWGYNQRRYMREFLEKNKEKPIPENFQKFQKMCEEIETLLEGKIKFGRMDSFNSKVEQYIEKTHELGRRPLEADKCYFKDGHSMVAWYHAKNKVLKQEKISLLEPLQEDPIKELDPFLKMKRQLYQEGYYGNQNWKIKAITFEERTKEYLADFKAKQENSGIADKFFSDGVKKESWYHYQTRFVRSERKQEKVLSDERKKEVELFARMENEMLKIKDVPRIRISRFSNEEKISYLVQLLNGEIDPSLSKDNIDFTGTDYYFPDGVCMNCWISNHRKEVEIYLDDPKPTSFEERVLEYQEAAKKLGRKLKVRDPHVFSDRLVMAPWLARQERKVKEERKKASFPIFEWVNFIR